MKLERQALMAEVISGIAIVVTLVFLIHEVRTNSALLERQLQVERANRADMSDSPYLPAVLRKIKAVDEKYVAPDVQAFMERYELTFVEAQRWVWRMRTNWRAYEADFLLDGDSDALADQIRLLLSFPDQQLFWDTSRVFDERFIEYVDSLERTVAETGG